MLYTFHYTNKKGWDAIRSQKQWTFKAHQPKDVERPVGAYFTDIEPTEHNLRMLYIRVRVPKAKRKYVFCFVGRENLKQLNGGRARDRFIYFSPIDYVVPEDRQRYGDRTDRFQETFS